MLARTKKKKEMLSFHFRKNTHTQSRIAVHFAIVLCVSKNTSRSQKILQDLKIKIKIYRDVKEYMFLNNVKNNTETDRHWYLRTIILSVYLTLK